MDLIYTDYLGINIHAQKDSESNATNDSDNNIEYMPHSTIYKQPNYDVIRLNPIFNHIYNNHTHQTLGQFITTINTNTTTNSNNTSVTSPTYTHDPTTFLNEGVKEEEEDVMDWATAIYLSTNKPEYTSTITTNSTTTVNSTITPAAAAAGATNTSSGNSTNTITTTAYGNNSINTIKISFLRNVHCRSAVRIPHLSEICYKKVAESAVILTEEMAKLGGSRPDVPWMQVYFICCVVYCVLIYRIIM